MPLMIVNLILAALLLAPPLALAADAATAGNRPNIVFILADDLGWADLPLYGNRFNEAPRLTRLAEEGIRFTDAYAAAPVCSPTRASIMSGQYPARVGVFEFIPGHWRPFEKVTVPTNRTQYLPAEIVTMAEALKTAGYATGFFGKWHLGYGKDHHPSTQGFDEANVGQGYYTTRFDPPRQDSAEKIMAERLADFGIDFIERNKARPFFLFLSHWDVHVQFDAEQARIEKFLKKPPVVGYPCHAIYAAMIEQLDHSVGRVVDKLDALGLRDNTLVVFFSDNGGQISNDRYPGVQEAKMPVALPSRQDIYRGTPRAYIATSNAPLRGEKGMLYEGGIREPLIMTWPGRIKPGRLSQTPVTSVDFYPTFLDVAGAQKPEGQVLDGTSILPDMLNGQGPTDRALYWHYPVYHHHVPASAVRKDDWKLVQDLVTGNIELYNLATDIGETTDLSGVFPDKAQELHGLLKQWQTNVKAEFPQPNPAFDEQKRLEWARHPQPK